MHECPSCGQMCDCDGEDHMQPAPPECECEAEDYENEGALELCPLCDETDCLGCDG